MWQVDILIPDPAAVASYGTWQLAQRHVSSTDNLAFLHYFPRLEEVVVAKKEDRY